MRKLKNIFTIFIIVLFVAGLLAGCTNAPQRKLINTNQGRRDYTPTNTPGASPNTMRSGTGANPNGGLSNISGNGYNTGAGYGTGTNTGSNMASTGGKISATFEMMDFTYLTPTVATLTIRSWPSAAAPAVGTVSSGQRLHTIGKLDGWYAVVIPNTRRIGCVPAGNLRLFPMGTAPTTNPTGTIGSGGGTGTTGSTNMPGTTGTTGTTNMTGTTGTTPGYGQGTTTGTTTTPTAAGSGTMSSDEARILQLCNAERAKTGAKPLKGSADLVKLARMKSQDMVTNNYFSHQSPTYGSPFDMMKKYGVNYMYAGENIAMNQAADRAFTAWMGSEGHRKNILNPNFTEIGIGIASKGGGSYIYTQEFIGR